MNSIMKLVGVYFLVFIVGIVMSAMQINFYIILASSLVIVSVGLIIPFLRIVFWETDIEKLEKFFVQNKKNPNYNLIYALANNLDHEVEIAITRLLKKDKQRHKQALYKVVFALYKKDIVSAKDEVDYIKPVNYLNYYKSIVLMEEGNLNEASELIEQISIPWMKKALLAEMGIKKNKPDEAKRYAKEALDLAKGLQRYLLYKNYQREFE